MKQAITAALIVVMIAGIGCTDDPKDIRLVPEAPEEGVKAVARANNAFAVDLYKQIMSREGNLFLSPYSISTALAMTYAGARGETEKQMAAVLHFDLSGDELHPAMGALMREVRPTEESSCELKTANALWGQKGYKFLPAFLTLTKQHYGAGLNEVDFARATEAARKTINTWVEAQTEGRIEELIKPGMLTPATRLVLTNAIYFLGAWETQFDPKRTHDARFTLLDGKTIQTPMMVLDEDLRYAKTPDVQVLELPYKGTEVVMIVVLPAKIDGLPNIEKSLNHETLAKWIAALKDEEDVYVYLPRFKMTVQFRLAKQLQDMGMTDAFDPEDANFSGMTTTEKLCISKVIHKAFVEVTETGTEAAAATAVIMEGGIEPNPTIFRADHPFLFFIVDKQTGSILFMGRMANPVDTAADADPIDAFLKAVESKDFREIVRQGEQTFKPGALIPDHAARFGKFQFMESAPGQLVYVFFSVKGDGGAASASLFVEKETGKIIAFRGVDATF